MSYDAPPPPPPPPPPPGGYTGGPGGPAYGAAPKSNKKALWSMILGILGVICCSGIFVVGIAAIVLSRSASQEIAASGGQQTGAGMAKAGLILGIIGVVFGVVYWILVATGAIDINFSSSSS